MANSNPSSSSSAAGSDSAAPVSKDDLVRIVELFQWPEAQTHITNALGTMNRAELDSRKSTCAPSLSGEGSLADAGNAWRELAAIFMNYDDFCPQNRLILYENDDNGQPVPFIPYRPADPDQSAVVARCHDLKH